MGPGTAGNSPWIGRTIAGYRIDRHIGSGLTGDVFHAVSPALEPHEAAVKILNVSRQLTSKQYQEFYARFEQEAAILKRLNNPHILRVLAAGQDEGTPYMVLPYVDGGTLSRRLENGQISVDEAALYLAQLADALDSAHASGVVHRDIKPANILLDRNDTLFLTDFSIARLLDETQTGLTTTGNVMGTAAYMAPEQVKNEKGVGPAADIYSLGIVLYQMVTGRPPFSANTMYALMEKQVNEAPPQPRQFRDDLPEPAGAVILKALAKNPRDRYASAGAFSQAFTTALQGVWPAGLSPNVSASLPTDYSPPTLPTTVLVPRLASPFPVGRLTSGRAWGAIVAVTLVVVVLAALLLNHGGNSTGPGGPVSTFTSSATSHSPTVSVGPGTPTVQPGQPNPTAAPGQPNPTTIPGQPISTSAPTAIPTPPSMYGDGSDGLRTISIDTIESPQDATCSGTTGSSSLFFANASSTFASTSGKPVLIHQSQGSGAGTWMRNKIASVSGTTSGTLTLESPLNATYSAGAQIIVLPEYTNVTVSSGVTWTAKAWNGATGGILAFLASGTVTVNGTVSATGRGFRGGSNIASTSHTLSPNVGGIQGEGTASTSSARSTSPNGNGGGGGGTFDTNPSGLAGARGAGAGGGNSAAGSNGASYVAGNGGTGGDPSGLSNPSMLTFGGGGGSGGNGHDYYLDGFGNDIGGDGGNGGGVICIFAVAVVINNAIAADGGTPPNLRDGTPLNGKGDGRGGGGGAGGSILLQTQTGTVGIANIRARGATGGTAQYPANTQSGGNGADGRIFAS